MVSYRVLTHTPTSVMVFHMKTTLMIPDPLMRRLRLEAARQGTTISELVEAALRLLLDTPAEKPQPLTPLPTFDGGRMYVDVSNRDALYTVMEER